MHKKKITDMKKAGILRCPPFKFLYPVTNMRPVLITLAISG